MKKQFLLLTLLYAISTVSQLNASLPNANNVATDIDEADNIAENADNYADQIDSQINADEQAAINSANNELNTEEAQQAAEQAELTSNFYKQLISLINSGNAAEAQDQFVKYSVDVKALKAFAIANGSTEKAAQEMIDKLTAVANVEKQIMSLIKSNNIAEAQKLFVANNLNTDEMIDVALESSGFMSGKSYAEIGEYIANTLTPTPSKNIAPATASSPSSTVTGNKPVQNTATTAIKKDN